MASHLLGWPLIGVASLVLMVVLADLLGFYDAPAERIRQIASTQPETMQSSPTRIHKQEMRRKSGFFSPSLQEPVTSPYPKNPEVIENGSSAAEPMRMHLEAHIFAVITASDAGDRISALLELWRSAADSGVPEEAIQEFIVASYDPNPQIAALAVRALTDLENLRETKSRAEMLEADLGMSAPVGDEPTESLEQGTIEDTKEDPVAAEVERLITKFHAADIDERLEALLQLWRFAADVGVPERALDLMVETAAWHPDPRVAEIAEQASADLEKMWNRLATEEEAAKTVTERSAPQYSGGTSADLPSLTEAEQVVSERERIAAAQSEAVITLAEQLEREIAPHKRISLVAEIGDYRIPDSVNVLLDSLQDQDVGMRYESVLSLWRYAADGLDQDRVITDALRRASFDPDVEVAGVARDALNDLRRLESAFESFN